MSSTILDLFPADLLDEGIALEGNPAAIGKLHLPRKLAVRCGVDVATILDLFPADLLDEGIALEGNIAAIGKLHLPRKLAVRRHRKGVSVQDRCRSVGLGEPYQGRCPWLICN